jgi:hypothetical protein
MWNVSVNSPILNARVTKPISNPTLIICNAIFPAKIFVVGLGCRITLPSAGSEANANPGNPSVTRLIHKI